MPAQQSNLIGYPNGLPLKITDGVTIRKINETLGETNLDIFKGNSGGPAFLSETKKAIGIVVGSTAIPDYHFNREKNCIETTKFNNTDEDLSSSIMRFDLLLEESPPEILKAIQGAKELVSIDSKFAVMKKGVRAKLARERINQNLIDIRSFQKYLPNI